ncbi:Hypothetical protein DPCES_1406 [Desulfitobacterium hafniense]|uniref:Head decoration protein n=1 Tax=Desulfitobacterium hafniense TaxID=49338 RepID=A0A098AXG1_DESHA|nr:hypothetical protein [Desulfitobacterium hafniense]CDX01293.1 Hypothetical protein DPCES_1406 [Desulfitobacterium hafniense]
MSLLDNFTPDKLFAGNTFPVVTETGIVIGTHSRGTILGKILKGAVTSMADEDNTGDGAVTQLAIGQAAKVGDYVVTCITAPTVASANNAKFSVVSPDGEQMVNATQGVAYASNQVNFIIGNATEADFVVGDKFIITVAAGSEKYTNVSRAAVDGSDVPYAILAEDIVGSTDGAVGVLYMSGEFNEDALIVPEGETVASYKGDLRKIGIFLKSLD